MFWTMMDDISNEKAPARIRRGAWVDWLGPLLAEGGGVEPTVMLPLRLISRQVHSTALPPLLVLVPKPAIIATIATVFRVGARRCRPGRGAARAGWLRCRRVAGNFPAAPPGCGPRPGPSL